MDRGLPFELMAELGLDLPAGQVPSVFDMFRDDERFDYVVTLCEGASARTCPAFQRNVDCLYSEDSVRLSWSLPDFQAIDGPSEERYRRGREIRDAIQAQVRGLLAEILTEGAESARLAAR